MIRIEDGEEIIRESPGMVPSFSNFLAKQRIFMCIIWVGIIGYGGFCAPKFLGNTELTFNPPPHSEAEEGLKITKEAFPGVAYLTQITVIVQSGHSHSLSEKQLINVTSSVFALVTEEAPHIVLQNVQSYYTALQANLTLTKNAFWMPGQDHSIITFELYDNDESHDLVLKMRGKIPRLGKEAGVRADIAALSLFDHDASTAAVSDFEKVDGVAMPIALGILGFTLGSLRLVIFPLIVVLASLASSFGIMYYVSTAMSVSTICPSIMGSVILALSIDYSLFLLSRFREELIILSRRTGAVDGDGRHASYCDRIRVVTKMLQTAGHTILVSGCTLATCFLGLVAFPVDILRSIGVGAAVAIFMTVLTSATLVPSLLYTFWIFFASPPKTTKYLSMIWNYCTRYCSKPERSFTLDEPLINGISGKYGDSFETEEETSRWYKTASTITSKNWRWVVLIVGTLTVTVPFAFFLTKLKTNMQVQLMVPRDAQSTDAFQKIYDVYGAGVLYPFQLVISSANADDQITQQKFQDLLAGLNEAVPKGKAQFDSFVWNRSGPVNLTEARQANRLDCVPDLNYCVGSNPYCTETVCLAQDAYRKYINRQKTSIYANVNLRLDPLSDEGVQWLKEARRYLHDAEGPGGYGFEIGLWGQGPNFIDEVNSCLKMFPIVIAVVVVVVYLLIGIAFQSFFVPLRAVLTIAFSLTCIYGAATLIYCIGILNWIGWDALKGHSGLNWMIPVMAFTVLVGLGLDYDVFLLSRIVEYRKKGLSTKTAIVEGLWRTGPIITSAGCIMAVAFAGLLLSGITALNQYSFMLTFGVLLDTFVIRTLIVPAMMSILGDINWWPTVYPANEPYIGMHSP